VDLGGGKKISEFVELWIVQTQLEQSAYPCPY